MSHAAGCDTIEAHADTMHSSGFIKSIYIHTSITVDLVRTSYCVMQNFQMLTIIIQHIDYAEQISRVSRTTSSAEIGTSKWATANRQVGHICLKHFQQH